MQKTELCKITLKKILIIGANGFLGKRLLSQFESSENITNTADNSNRRKNSNTADLNNETISVEENTPKHTVKKEYEIIGADISIENIPERFQPLVLDITNSEMVFDILEKIIPDVVILTAAMTNVDACEDNPKLAFSINAQGPENVCNALLRNKKGKLIHLSTDFVFDGRKGNYTEQDSPNPISLYGESKLKGEELIIKSGVDYAICRTSVIYGWPNEGDRDNFFSWAYKSLAEKKKLTIIKGQTTTPTYVEDLAHFLVHFSKTNLNGIFHTTGPEAVSRYEFVQKIIEHYNLEPNLLSGVDNFTQKAQRPENSSLNTDKIQKLSIYCFKSLQDNFQKIENNF